MARIQIASEGWGWLSDINGTAQPNRLVTLNGTVYDSQIGGSPIASVVTDANGRIPGYIEEGSYTLVTAGVTQAVEAAAGGPVGASARLRPSGGDDSAQVINALANYAPYISPVIVLGPGTFLWNTAVPAFARDLAAKVIGSGTNATTIKLSSAAPRAFDFYKIADYDTFRDIEIGEFTVDDNNVGLRNHIVIGTYPTPATSQFRLNFKRLRIHHIRTINVPSAGTTGDYTATTHHPLNINIAVQDTVTGGTRLTAEDITVEDCRFEGGNEGVFIGGGGVNADGLNIWLDRIRIRRCWHSVITLSPNYAPQNHFQIGSRGIGGYGEISDCYGWGSGDDGVETNGFNTTVVERCTMEDVRGWGFLHTNYNTPENVDSQICTWRDTTVRRTQQASDPGSGFVGWYGSGRRIGAVDIPAGNHKLINAKYYTTVNFPRNACVVGILTGGAAGAGVANGFKSFEIDGLIVNASGYTNATASLTAQQVIRMTNGSSAAMARVRIRNVSIKVNATQGSTGGDGHTCLYLEGVLKVDVDGFTPDLTVAGGNQSSVLVGCDLASGTISGRIRGMRVAGISGDPNPRGIIIRSTSLVSIARLDIEECDFSGMAAGVEVLFTDTTNQPKVFYGKSNIWRVYPNTVGARRIRGYVNLLESDYALPTDGSDVTAAINAVLAAVPNGTTIYAPSEGPGALGFYTVSGLLAPPVGKSLRFVGDGAGATIFTRSTNSADFLHVAGSKTTIASSGGVLTANATAGDSTLAITNASSLVAGDYLNLRSNRVNSIESAVNRDGEIVRIKSIASNTLTLQGSIADSYTTANVGIVDKINFLTGVTVEGITFRGVKQTGTFGGLLLSYCLNSWVRDCELSGLDNPAYQSETCLGGGAERLFMHDLTNDIPNSRVGYGVNCGGASTDMVFSKLSSQMVRHTFTTGGTANGIPRRITVSDSIATDPTAAAFDTHQSAQFINFHNLTVVGSALGEDGTSFGQVAQLRAPDCTIDGIVAQKPSPTVGMPGIGVTVGADRAVIKNARVKTSGAYQGIGIYADDCRVENCDVDSAGAGTPGWIVGNRCTILGGRYANSSALAAIKAVSGSGHIIDTTVENSLAGTFYGVYVQGGANVQYVNVRIRNSVGIMYPLHGTSVPYSWANQTVLVATLDVPMNVAAVAVTGGGTFAAGTYYYKITAINAAGETLPSAEVSATVTLNGSIVLTWLAPPQTGATGYKVYRSTSAGAENVSPALVATLGDVRTYTDTGSATSAGNVPAANTATLTSPLIWTNPYPGSGQLAIYGGSGLGVFHRRGGQVTALVSSGPAVAQVGVGDGVQVSYTTAPTCTFIPDVS